VLVVQAQSLIDSEYTSSLVVPLTTQLIDDAEPLRIRVQPSRRLYRASDILIAQLRAIDNRRLVQGPLLRLDHGLMARVEAAIREVLGLKP
jgi:mRNA interferase MazF